MTKLQLMLINRRLACADVDANVVIIIVVFIVFVLGVNGI